VSDVPPAGGAAEGADDGAAGAEQGPAGLGEPTREWLRKERDEARREAQNLRGRLRESDGRVERLGTLIEVPPQRLEVLEAMARHAVDDPAAAAADARRYADLIDPPSEADPPLAKEAPVSDTPPAASADPAATEFAGVIAGFVDRGLTVEDFAKFGEAALAAKEKEASDAYEAAIDKRAEEKLAHRDRLAAHQNLSTFGVPTDTKEGSDAADLIIRNVRNGVPQADAIRMVAQAKGWEEVIGNLDGALGAKSEGGEGAAGEKPPEGAAGEKPPAMAGPAIAPLGTFQAPPPDTSKPASEKPADRSQMKPRDRMAAAIADPKYGFSEDTVRRGQRVIGRMGTPDGVDRPRPDEFETIDGRVIPV